MFVVAPLEVSASHNKPPFQNSEKSLLLFVCLIDCLVGLHFCSFCLFVCLFPFVSLWRGSSLVLVSNV